MSHRVIISETRHEGARFDSFAGTFPAVRLPACCFCRATDDACRCTVVCANCGADTWADEAETIGPRRARLGYRCLDCIRARCF